MKVSQPLLRVCDYAEWYALHRPNDEAFVFGDSRLNYADVFRQVKELSKALIAAGVTRGDRVATLQLPRPEYFTAFLATISIGAIWVGLNPRYRVQELLHIVSDSEPSVLITRTRVDNRSFDEEIAILKRECASLRHVVAFAGEPAVDGVMTMDEFLALGIPIDDVIWLGANQRCEARDPCLIVYTSGSTGAPKGAVLHQHGLVQAGIKHNESWPADPHVTLNYFPINHVGCVVDISIPAFVAGGKIIFLDHFDPAIALDLMQKEEVTLWLSVPSTFLLQLALPNFDSYDLSAIQLIGWGGAAMPLETIERLRAILPRLTTSYGLTESGTSVTVVEPTDDIEVLSQSVGLPVEGVDMRLVSPDGSIVPQGEPGEIQIRSDEMFLGYWRRPDANAEVFTSDGFFRTGDQAFQRPDGRYRIVGRLKEMYKSGGYNVYPREIEEVLEEHPAVAAAAVVSAPHPLWQEVGIAYVILQNPITAEELISYCRDQLANYKVPKRLVIKSEMPLLPIGKIDKTALKKEAALSNG